MARMAGRWSWVINPSLRVAYPHRPPFVEYKVTGLAPPLGAQPRHPIRESIMVQYIVKLAKTIESKCNTPPDMGELFKLLPALAEELDRLDPRDFLPDAQYDFVVVRIDARKWGEKKGFIGTDPPEIAALAKRVIDALEKYGGNGSRVTMRSFAFVKDTDLRQIIERDYRELRLNVYPSGAWKSTVILAGSILEAVLFDQLTTDPAVRSRAEASAKAPKVSGKVKDLAAGEWKLAELIEVAVDINVLPADRAKSFDQVLRDYRNFVHPKKEIKAQHPCTEAEAMMAIGALEGACNILK